MGGMFEPDDDRDEDEGWDSMADYLEDRGDDMMYPDSTPDGVQTDRVDVDPALFGELPEGRIEEITADPSSVATAEAVQEWKRQVTLIRLTDACPHCDGPVETHGDRRTSDMIEYVCLDCGDAWVSEV
jgi:hypothetical protein